MFCKECGKKIDDHSKFCSFCGTKQSLVQLIQDDTEIINKQDIPTQNVNVTLSFKKSKVETKEDNTKDETKNIIKNEKYDKTYGGDEGATVAGIIVIVIYLILLSTIRIENEADQLIYRAIAAIVNLIWRIIATIWVVNIAKRQNRSTPGWGLFAFFIPNLALIIIGFLKKLLLSTSLVHESELSYNSHLSNNLINNTIKSQIESEDHEHIDSLTYSITKSDTKRSFFKNYDIYYIEFFDHKKAAIYSFDSKLFYITNCEGTCYYKNKESAIKALYLYLTTKEIYKGDLAYIK